MFSPGSPTRKASGRFAHIAHLALCADVPGENILLFGLQNRTLQQEERAVIKIYSQSKNYSVQISHDHVLQTWSPTCKSKNDMHDDTLPPWLVESLVSTVSALSCKTPRWPDSFNPLLLLGLFNVDQVLQGKQPLNWPLHSGRSSTLYNTDNLDYSSNLALVLKIAHRTQHQGCNTKQLVTGGEICNWNNSVHIGCPIWS